MLQKIIPQIITYQCDISGRHECEKLVAWIEGNFPDCNILINNAAIVHNTNFEKDNDIVEL